MEICDITTGIAQGNNFKLTLSRLPNTNYMCNSIDVPGFNLPTVNQPNPFQTIHHAGDQLQRDLLTVSFILNEGLVNWFEIYSWMEGLAFPKEFTQYQELEQSDEGLSSDAVITFFDSVSNPKLRLTFQDCHPVSLGGINMSSQQDSTVPLFCQMRLSFNGMSRQAV